LPVPDTVSPQIQKLIAAPLNPFHNQIPATPEEWKKQIRGVEEATVKGCPRCARRSRSRSSRPRSTA
jgi:hypothetical protein